MVRNSATLVGAAVALALLPRPGAAHSALNMELLGTVNTGGAEISAYDPDSRRIFTTNADGSVAIINASNPAALVQVGTIDVSAMGSPNSVAVRDGLVAIAIGNHNKVLPGRVAFYRTNGQLIGSVVVGALPDMLTFTPDGRHLLVANEGEPDGYGAGFTDPEGSVSIIRVPHGRKWSTPQVSTVDFTAYNGQEAALRAQGIRIYGPGASAAQDIEPEYISISDDSRIAYVTLQENNAVAKLDIQRGKVLALLPLGYKDWSQKPWTAATYELTAAQLPLVGYTTAGQPLRLGGFSGLYYEGVTDDGELKFIANTDRGPNGEPDPATGVRPFLLPQFAPRLVRFTLDPSNGQLHLTQQILLRDSRGRPLSGLPNLTVAGGNANTPHNDEVPVDLFGNRLALDALGGDFEGIAVDEDGSFWLPDEYRPAIYHFDSRGLLLQRFIPIGAHAAAGLPVPSPGTAGQLGLEALPSIIAQRRQNRGMEGIALRDGKVYGMVQSPARVPATLANGALNAMRTVRLVELDPLTLATRQFLYIMDNPASLGADDTRADKIGDMVATPTGFLAVERDDDAAPATDLARITKKVYAFALADATDVTGRDGVYDVGGTLKSIDQMSAAELATIGVKPLAKTLEVDLAAAGYSAVQKVEGLALLDDGRLAVVNDNDFQVAQIDIDRASGTFTHRAGYVPESTAIGLIERPGFDASDRDGPNKGGRIDIKPRPVLGMYLPDAIDSYRVRGRTYFVTANEGDTRADWPGFQEEARVKDLKLDPVAFPDPDPSTSKNELQNDEQLGRLKVTNTLGDANSDGKHEALYAFGGRSFSIWDSNGQQVFDSGSQLERLTALALPTHFNAGHDDPAFDSRSDDKGPEAEALAIGEIDGHTYAFVGMERIGGVAVYDISDPTAPVFLDYLNTRDFSSPEGGDLGPEGLQFIPAHDSPNRRPLLVVTSEISGTVSTFALDTERPWKRRFGWGWGRTGR